MHSVYHKDLLRVTKKVFKDFKGTSNAILIIFLNANITAYEGNDMSLVNRLIEVAVHRRKVSQALAALALCTDQSGNAKISLAHILSGDTTDDTCHKKSSKLTDLDQRKHYSCALTTRDC